MNKLLSSCCSARASVNVRDGGYVCSKCGSDCIAKKRYAGLTTNSTLSTVRKATGERELFVHLWAKHRGTSEVSGETLLPPAHAMFHYQGSHLLPKGTYPDYQLDERNIVMMTVDEHARWHREAKGLLLVDPDWAPIVTRYQRLREEAHRKGKFNADAIRESGNDEVQLLNT